MASQSDIAAFIDELLSSPEARERIVAVREVPARPARSAEPAQPLSDAILTMLRARGIDRLYSHQALAIDLARAGRNIVLASGTASGKSLCYQIPVIETLAAEPLSTACFLYPTKALTQDQFQTFSQSLKAAGLGSVVAGVYDGDTSPNVRRRLRDGARVLLTNPDMVHAGILPQHARFARFFENLKWIVIDEIHAYNGIFGSNVASLMRRVLRLCDHYGASPQVIAGSASIGNPREHAEAVVGRPFELIDDDGSPSGRRVFLFWNPPVEREATWRSRRSANVEAYELMTRLVRRGIATVTFSKAKVSAEMIYRYVAEDLSHDAPGLAERVTAYRGGYLPEDRRAIERRLFAGELIGVSTTPALELGIDVGDLDAGIIVGYPGMLASFFQQAGRAGRRGRDALVILVGLDTPANQYVMAHPEYIFDRPIERVLTDEDNAFILTGHLRCATHELPVAESEVERFGRFGPMVLRVLEDNQKVKRMHGRWYHAAHEIPQHEISLRQYADRNAVIQDIATGQRLGELNKFDVQPIVHPDAIYMHQGETYRVVRLDLERNLVLVEKVDVDYYTQPLGGTDIHHVDHTLREKPFGSGMAYWGEATAYFRNFAYERIHFYSLDAISVHPLDLPDYQLETMALWMVPPESLMKEVIAAGIDAHRGLRGIGYATRMMLPVFMTCDTWDFSHTIGSANSPWQSIFIYERFPLGLGFTQTAYARLHEILPAVQERLRTCSCEDGCPMCVGKPLRRYATWNVERMEAQIPSKSSALAVLEGYLGDGTNLRNEDTQSLAGEGATEEECVELALRRRLERMREPEVFHPIDATAMERVGRAAVPAEDRRTLDQADVARREERRRNFAVDLRKAVRRKPVSEPTPRPTPPPMPRGRGHAVPPTAFPTQPISSRPEAEGAEPPARGAIEQGDPLAAKARRLKRSRRDMG